MDSRTIASAVRLPIGWGFSFCTADGLSRFDGSRFINYGTAQGLTHPEVNAFVEAGSGISGLEPWVGWRDCAPTARRRVW